MSNSQHSLIEQLAATRIDITNMPHQNLAQDGENLGYAPKKKFLLGFHGVGIPLYIWDLCAWMSVKSKHRDKNEQPYFYYDDEKMLVTFDINDKKHTVVDKDGIAIHIEDKTITGKLKKLVGGFEYKKHHELMQQLNEAWVDFSYIPQNTSVKKAKP